MLTLEHKEILRDIKKKITEKRQEGFIIPYTMEEIFFQIEKEYEKS